MVGRFFKRVSLFRRAANGRVIDRLHGDIMAASRQPGLYLRLGVPDTFEGRFEIFSLLAITTVRRLRELPPSGLEMAQDLTDAIFRHLDIMLREMGVGDLAVPKRVRAIAAVFVDRARLYIAIWRDDDAFARALHRYVLRGQGDPAPLLAYIHRATDALADIGFEQFSVAPLRFPEAAPSSEEDQHDA
jgi:cytochrome b pre-mRNA-processing protein 3